MAGDAYDRLHPLETERTSAGPTVSVAKCLTYERKAVDAAVRDCVDRLGGIRKFVSRGETILLKPNMLSPKSPDKAVTTHPEVVRAVIGLVREAGAIPIVGDTPGGPATEFILRNLAEKTGIGVVCKEEGVEFVLFSESKRVQFPQGVVAKSFELATQYEQVDGLISLAKFKTHSLTVLTGAVKNLFGLIPGLKKAEYHYRMQSAEALSELLVDLAECIQPRLTIMDGIIGMDGDGPAAGRPINLGIILASANVHEMDAFMAEIAEVDPMSVPTLAVAMRRGLIPKDRSYVSVLGADTTSLAFPGFELPPAAKRIRKIPRAFAWVFGEFFSRKPVFSRKSCTMCGQCIAVCPAHALVPNKKRPSIDRRQCIRCYCCSEVCAYDAVSLKRVPGRSIYSGVSKKIRRTLRRA